RVAPVGTVPPGHRDGALGLGGVERPPAPVHVVRGNPGFEVVPPYAGEGVQGPGGAAELADPDGREVPAEQVPTRSFHLLEIRRPGLVIRMEPRVVVQ